MDKIDLKGSVILNPVPVVLVTSKNKAGKINVFTVGWTGTINTKPPMLYISVRPERLSYEYIKETMEFVVNLPGSDLVKKVDYCGVRSGKKNDKITEMGFTLIESSNISVPYINECHINIECKVKNIIPLGTHDMFIAEVIGSHVNKDLFDDKGKIHFEDANMMSYCHGEYYPLAKRPTGSFGFSVMKKKTKKRRNLQNQSEK
ncbi:flavin reductase family protein [Clostridium sp. BL-8]|uniref:flavin reductase family protein n=1 Tax=Clostridium sp. BL-8 TaxID=349938 RepID=UPI00098CBD8C|nr:flavin reductase family protein [Clostridium sp. BL-8]OOM78224.1 flavoredoxin [Clostridium sp. BL-8]